MCVNYNNVMENFSRKEPEEKLMNKLQAELDHLKSLREEEKLSFDKKSRKLWLPDPKEIKSSCSRWNFENLVRNED